MHDNPLSVYQPPPNSGIAPDIPDLSVSFTIAGEGKAGKVILVAVSRQLTAPARTRSADHQPGCCSKILLLMRRMLASLLLVLVTAGFALPFLAAPPDVPACCRRGGMHHCMAPLQGNGFHSVAPCCRYRHPAALTSHVVTALSVPLQVLIAPSGYHDFARLRSADGARDLAGDVRKRGPPPA